MRGMRLPNASPGDLAEAHAAIAAGLADGDLRPAVGRELPLAEAPRAHREIIAGPAARQDRPRALSADRPPRCGPLLRDRRMLGPTRPALRAPRDVGCRRGSPQRPRGGHRDRLPFPQSLARRRARRARPRDPALEGPLDVDVAIVGAGYTGLWTAYYLKKADPHLRVAVLEREIAGFGASGRNGGWCSSFFAGSREATAKRHGRDGGDRHAAGDVRHRRRGRAASPPTRASTRASTRAAPSCRPPTSPQLLRAQEEIEYERSWGFGEEDYRLLGAEEAAVADRRDRQPRRLLHPALRLRRPGAAGARPRRRRREAWACPSTSARPPCASSAGRVETPVGAVTAEVVVRATEGYTVELPGFERVVLPLYSLMIATEPLAADVWDAIGWREHETFNDERFLIVYAMRTEDDRLAIGGRGAPYHWGSRVERRLRSTSPASSRRSRRVVASALPADRAPSRSRTPGAAPSASPATGTAPWASTAPPGSAWAGGYVGDGVGTTNLAGRTLRDLILGHDTELTAPALGRPPLAALGARAAALARRQRGDEGDGQRRQLRGAHRPAEQAGDDGEEAHRRLRCIDPTQAPWQQPPRVPTEAEPRPAARRRRTLVEGLGRPRGGRPRRHAGLDQGLRPASTASPATRPPTTMRNGASRSRRRDLT